MTGALAVSSYARDTVPVPRGDTPLIEAVYDIALLNAKVARKYYNWFTIVLL
jgi:hypothetical protein